MGNNQYQDNFEEGQIQFLGKPLPDDGKKGGNRKMRAYVAIAIATLIVTAIVVAASLSVSGNKEPNGTANSSDSLYHETFETHGVWEQEENKPESLDVLTAWFNQLDTITAKYCALMDTAVNDIPVRFYMPLNSTPQLCLGTSYVKDNSSVLILQAADIRADNKKIVGAFVLKGKPLAWGLSKKGYCAIINDEIEVGMADNSPLFEKATETGGYFFRQYALVHNGKIVEQELKTRSLRRALCQMQQHIFVAETLTEVSMHDFSQALVDLGVQQAIYLIGGESRVAWTDSKNQHADNKIQRTTKYKNINFIRWQ